MKYTICLVTFFLGFQLICHAQLPPELDCTAFTMSPFLDTTCGTLNVLGGAGSRNVFCEGEEIQITNNSVGDRDFTLYCWRDGQSTLVPGNGGATHRYSFPRDTCIVNNRNVTRQIYMIGFKRCGNDRFSVNYIIIPVEIRAKPKAAFSVVGTPCVGENTQFRNEACPNMPEATYTWYFGDGSTSNASSLTVAHRYLQEGPKKVRLVVRNSCDSAVFEQTINVLGLPRAEARVLSPDLPKVNNEYIVCLSQNPTVRLTGIDSKNSTIYEWINNRLTFLPRRDTVATVIAFRDTGRQSIILMTDNGCGRPSYDTLFFRVFLSQNIAFRPQPDTCSAFLYRPSSIVAGATYTLNGSVFNPSTGVSVGQNTTNFLEIRLQTPCDTLSVRDTFNVFTADPVFFRRPSTDTTVCQNGGLIFLDVAPTGGNILPSNFIVRRNDSLFFNPSVAGTFPLNYSRGTGECLRRASRTITVLAAARLTLNRQDNRCQPFLYRPSPIVAGAIYSFNGTPFDPNVGIQAPINTSPHEVVAVLSNLCGSDTQRISFRVTGAVTIQMLSKDSVVCRQGGRIVLRATASDGSGTWSGTGVSHPIFDPSVAGVGEHRATFTASQGECANSQSVTFSVRGVQNIDAGADIVLCNARRSVPLVLRGGIPNGGIFRLNSPTGNAIAQIDPSVFPPSARIFYVIEDSICRSFDSLNVSINAISSANISIPNAVCVDQPFSASPIAPGPDLRFRLFVNDTLRSASLPFEYRFKQDGLQTVSIEIGNAANCFDTISRTIDVRRAPIVRIVAPASTLCHNQRLAVENDTTRNDSTTTYQWVFRNLSFETTQLPPLSMSNIGCADSVYALKLRASTGVCPSVEVSQNIVTRPQTRARVAVQGADTICANQLVKFVNNSCGSRPLYRWQIDNFNFTGFTPPDMRFENTGDTLRVVNIRLIAQDSCNADTNAIRLWVYPLSIKARFGYNRRVSCQPFTVNFRSQSPLASSILWDFGDGTTSTSSAVSKTFDSAGIFRIRFRAFHPCGGFEDIVDSIVVLSSPQTAGLTFEKPDKCRENQIRIIPRITNGVQGKVWVDGHNLVDSSRNPTLTFPNSGSFWVKYAAINVSTGCERIDSGLVVIQEPLKLLLSTASDSCGDGKGKVFLNPVGGRPGYMVGMHDTSSRLQNNLIFDNLPGQRNYTFFVKDNQGCWASATTRVDGRAQLNVSAGGDSKIFLGDSVFRVATTNYPIRTVAWQSIESGIRNSDTRATVIFPVRTATFRVLVVDSLGCRALDSFKIEVIPIRNVNAPNVFSPNGDGKNDFFFPSANQSVKEITYLKVFERGGTMIFENHQFKPNKADFGWDGKFKGEAMLPQTFGWVMEVIFLDGETMILRGDLTLVR